jgi:hypothetical protein
MHDPERDPDNRNQNPAIGGQPTQVYGTPEHDGTRSTAGSNYGDWRPNHAPRPHGVDYDAGPVPAPDFDPEFAQLRNEHMRDLDHHYDHWRRQRFEQFKQDFGTWREQQRLDERRNASEQVRRPDGTE